MLQPLEFNSFSPDLIQKYLKIFNQLRIFIFLPIIALDFGAVQIFCINGTTELQSLLLHSLIGRASCISRIEWRLTSFP